MHPRAHDVVLAGPGEVRLEPSEVPPLGSGEVRLRTRYSGISAGTELTQYRGSNPYLHKRWDRERRLPEGMEALPGSFSQIGAIALNGVHDANVQVGGDRGGVRRGRAGADRGAARAGLGRSYRWDVMRMARTAMELQAAGTLRLSELVTHVLPVERADEAFRMLDEGAPEALQVVLDVYAEGSST